MTDNRTNEPTEAQVKAAAIVMHRDTGPRGGYGWTEYLSQARAALVAAQGAAPQAECTEAPGGRPCEASKPGHKLHYSNGEARGE